MNIRQPARAGSFYEDSPVTCRHHAAKLIEAAHLPAGVPRGLRGGLVPHAGWMYSGRLAAMTLKALVSAGGSRSFILLGADHMGTVRKGELYDAGVWRTPLGEVRIDEPLAAALLKNPCLRANPRAHEQEHSIEVQVPLLQMLLPEVSIVPIGVPPTAEALEIGQAIGETLAKEFPGTMVVGSTDLTHHGGHFPAPGGRGAVGEQWTRRNDRRILDLIERLDAAGVLSEAQAHGNACGAGAIAAAITACQAQGATRGVVLDYTNSYEIIHALYPFEPDDTTVGYASVVFA